MKLKSFISIALAAVLFSSTAVFAGAAAIKGDIDGDKEITVKDARKVLRAAIGMYEDLTDAQYNSCDYNCDGLVKVDDARMVLRVAIKLDAEEEDPDQPEQKMTKKELLQSSIYDFSHPFLGSSMGHYYVKAYQKWCTIYTIGDVLRPLMAQCGYSQDAIDKLAPNKYSEDLWKALISKNAGSLIGNIWGGAAAKFENIYTPSMLMGYYQQHEEDGLCKIYNFVTYYDDEITQKVVHANDIEKAEYKPEVGDILFITNKNLFVTSKQDYKYNYLIHTAQIVQVYDDGTFLTTEGAIIEPAEGDGVARVRERQYFWNDEIETNRDAYGNLLNVPDYVYSSYQFRYNSTVIVLSVVRPNWDIE